MTATKSSTDISYVIYCRKSTDEKSGMQTQSIPDQIQKCVDYAEKNGLVIKSKPKDFPFEDAREVARENNDEDAFNRKIYRETRNLYIIKEQETAKIPYKRKKRRKLINLIKEGKIEGIISYSPDRQARNVLEGGELIDLVDNEQVDLKYTNFHFEPNASGKMMLGIWFVLSKQYSDKLSEDITRGNKSKFLRGKALGKKKYGYTINEHGFYEPDESNFKLMRKAFDLKIYENKSDEYIASYLNKHGYQKSDGLVINPKRLGVVRRDPFYYGTVIREKASLIVSLVETNPAHKTLITEEEYFRLQDRFIKKVAHTRGKEKKDEYDSIRLVPENILKNQEGYGLAFYITPKKRFEEKLTKLKTTKPKADWKDVVSIHQTRYRLVNKKSKDHGLEITGELIEKAVSTFLKDIKISNKAYNAFISYSKQLMMDNNNKNNEETSRIVLLLNRKKSEKSAFMQKCLGANFNKEEEELYKKTITQFDADIDFYQKEIESISAVERSEIMEQVALVDLLKNMSSRFEKGTIVQKRKIINLLFSNIAVSNKKKLTLAVKPGLEELFSYNLEVMGFEPMSESHIIERLPS